MGLTQINKLYSKRPIFRIFNNFKIGGLPLKWKLFYLMILVPLILLCQIYFNSHALGATQQNFNRTFRNVISDIISDLA